MHIVGDTDIRNIGDDIRTRSIVANNNIKFSDYEYRNLVLAVLKNESIIDTLSSTHLPESVYRFIEIQKKFFLSMFEKNKSAKIVYGYTVDKDKAKLQPLFDLTNGSSLAPFYNIPILSRWKNQDKIFVTCNGKPAFMVVDYENLPLLALFKYMSTGFIMPSEKWDGREDGVKLVLSILAELYNTKCPTISTSLKEILNPSKDLQIPGELSDKFVIGFFDQITIPAKVKKEEESEQVIVSGGIKIPPSTELPLSEFVRVDKNKFNYLDFIYKEGVRTLEIDYPSLLHFYYRCSINVNGYLHFYTEDEELISTNNYDKNRKALIDLIKYEKVTIICVRKSNFVQ